MNQTTTLNGKLLHSIATRTDTAQRTMLLLATRERVRSNSDIQRTKNAMIRDGQKIVDADYNKFWEELQAAGVGSIVYGRKMKDGSKKADRFEWHYSLKSVGKAAIDGTDEQVESVNNVVQMPVKEVAQEAAQSKAIPLRKDFDVAIPANLTKEEAEYLIATIKRLTA